MAEVGVAEEGPALELGVVPKLGVAVALELGVGEVSFALKPCVIEKGHEVERGVAELGFSEAGVALEFSAAEIGFGLELGVAEVSDVLEPCFAEAGVVECRVLETRALCELRTTA